MIETYQNSTDNNGASAGITNNGMVTVSIGDGDLMLQTALNIEAAEHLVKVLQLSIDAAKKLKMNV